MEAVDLAVSGVVVKGVLATVIAIVVFIGSVWLLLSLVLGARLGYFVTASVTFGVMVIMSIIWVMSALGPKGAETSWEALAVGPDLEDVKGFGATYDVSGYPGKDWELPKDGQVLVEGATDSTSEAQQAKPVMETFVGEVVSPIPGLREKVEKGVKGPVELKPNKFSITALRMKQAEVDGKPSLVAVAKAVPSEKMEADLGGVEEAEITEVLKKVGDQVKTGDPIVKAKADTGTVEVKAVRDGTIVELALRKRDKIKTGVPFTTVDISGQQGIPAPVEVVAARVRGAVRIPAIYYLAVSVILFAVHMRGLASTERRLKAQAQTA